MRKHLAWLCSASLWCGTVAFAQEPARLPAATETSNDLEVANRLNQLQQRLERLEAENGQLKQSLFQSRNGADTGVTPANAELFNNAADPACPPQCQCPNCEPAKTGKGDWKTGWNNGIEWVSPDKAFKVHIGGRTQLDAVFVAQEGNALDGAGGISGSKRLDAVDFRRARLRADGTIYETIEYVAEFDFVNSGSVDPNSATPNTIKNTINFPAPTDLYWKFKEVPLVGNVYIGNYKDPIGFEHLMSSRWLNFLERSFNQDLFYGPNNNGFLPGITLTDTYCNERGVWAIGAYKAQYNSNVFAYDVGEGNYSTTGRLTWLLIDDKECHQLLHIGASGSLRDPNTVDGNDRIRFRARDLRNGPANLSTIYADTGTFFANHQYLANVELAGINGPWSFQAEWLGSWATHARSAIASPSLGTYYSTGSYAEVHYFLTGESRDYDRKAGVFTRIIPEKNFRYKNGCFEPGAWQVAFRYSTTNLNSQGITGGNLNDYTFGLNWFLNPNMKVQANYALLQRSFDKGAAHVDDGVIHQFGMRLAHDF
jgi:phosphate-selective porin OprO/OprP